MVMACDDSPRGVPLATAVEHSQVGVVVESSAAAVGAANAMANRFAIAPDRRSAAPSKLVLQASTVERFEHSAHGLAPTFRNQGQTARLELPRRANSAFRLERREERAVDFGVTRGRRSDSGRGRQRARRVPRRVPWRRCRAPRDA